MRRPIAFSLLLLLTVAAPAAAARSYRVDVPKALAKQIARAKDKTDVAILLPSRLIAERKRLYGSGAAEQTGYTFGLGLIRGCGGANACSVATFSAERGEEPRLEREVALAGGITGYYQGLSCGASCSDPMIEWVQDDVLYSIQATAGTKKTERRRMVRLANSAIRNGPR